MPKLAGTTCVSVGSLPHRRLVLCGCGYAPLCENLQASAALQSSPYLTTGQPVRRCLRAQAVARSQIVHSCVQAVQSIRMPAFGRSDLSPRRSISAQLFAVLVTMSPADSCSNGVRFDTSMSKWKNSSFFIRIEKRYSMNSGI